VADIALLLSNGVPVSMWGLQNEPFASGTSYSKCGYSAADYRATFAAVAPKIRAALPGVLIHADSGQGADGVWGQALRADPFSMNYVDAWTYHRIGTDSNEQITRNFRVNSVGRPVFNNEFEYLSGTMSQWRMINTAQSIMNWFNFQDSPTWFWLHALKPLANSEAQTFALGYWRPPGYTNAASHPMLPEGHWVWNAYNWNPISGFVRYLPWDSVRVQVNEASVMNDFRVLAWKTSDGRLCVAFSNRTPAPSICEVDFGRSATWEGFQFDLAHDNQPLGDVSGTSHHFLLPAYSVVFWLESTPYYRWCESHWPLRPAGQSTLKLADPDGDGRNNCAEYAFGGDPVMADAGNPVQIDPGGGGQPATVSCLQRRADPGLTYIPEVSTDLVNWFSGPDYFETVGTTPEAADWERVTYQFVGNLPEHSVALFRVKAVPF